MLASQVEQQHGDDEKKPLSISEALDVAKGSLEKLKLRVLGEVSEVNVKSGYANAYFTLKDETGTLPCQMWHDRFEKCVITLEVGMMVELVGRFSLYPKKGRMHFQVFAISVARACCASRSPCFSASLKQKVSWRPNAKFPCLHIP